MLRKSIILIFFVLLSGCSAFSTNYVPAGTKIVQHQALTIPTGNAHVFLQYGKITTASKVNRYESHCRFEVNNLSAIPPQVIEPGTYSVTAVNLHMIMVIDMSVFNYITEMCLHDATNPNIRRISCGNWANTDTGNYLSTPEMQQALGDYFEIVLP